jgi:hypothetical protein
MARPGSVCVVVPMDLHGQAPAPVILIFAGAPGDNDDAHHSQRAIPYHYSTALGLRFRAYTEVTSRVSCRKMSTFDPAPEPGPASSVARGPMNYLDWNLARVKPASLAVDDSPPAALNPKHVEFHSEVTARELER